MPLTSDNIIYRDTHLIAINKPAGMLTHPSWIDKDADENAMHALRDLIGQWVYPIHRLDRPTSGVLLFALGSQMAKLLADEFANRETVKTYLALVRGFTDEHEVIDYPLKDLWDKMTDKEKSKDNPAKEAVTEYWKLATTELPIPVRPHQTSRYTLIKVVPHTGRSRQIRRHMKHIFHHMIGDHQHGDGFHNRMLAEKFGLNRLMLHAQTLQIKHPVSNETLVLNAPIPKDFSEILEKIGIEYA